MLVNAGMFWDGLESLEGGAGMSRLGLDVSGGEAMAKRSKGMVGKIVIEVRKMPRYKRGWLRCNKCGLAFKPNQVLPSFFICPYCGTKLRSHPRIVKGEKRVRRIRAEVMIDEVKSR